MTIIHSVMRNLASKWKLLMVIAAVFMLMFPGAAANAASAEELDAQVMLALQTMYKSNPSSEIVGKHAKAILVFPRILKAGLVFGGSYGEGALLKNGHVDGYFNSVSASWGWQAGVESYGYVVFLMSDKAVKYLDKSRGWEIGIGPSIVVVNEGIAKKLSSTTLKDDAYAFVFNQQGLMVNLSIEGSKISRINRK